jgi:hypothetical protein
LANTTDLITNDLLDRYSLAINIQLELFICLVCHSAQTASGVIEHLKTKHKVHFNTVDRSQLKDLTDQANIATAFPDFSGQETPLVPFSGLDIRQVSGCPHCPYSAMQESVKKHILIQHPDEPKTALENVSVQQLNPGASRALFRVANMPSLTSKQEVDVLQEMEIFQWQKHTINKDTPNARMISPWLMRTGWHQYVQDVPPGVLCELAAMPSQDEYPELRVKVLEYFNKATDLLDQTDELVLQRVNSSDPTKE